MDPDGLKQAREQILEAQSSLRHIKRSLIKNPRGEGSGPAFKQLRRSLEAFRDLIGAWSSAASAEKLEDPASLRGRSELEARALRVESALRDMEERQNALDLDRERALSELERVQEGWRLMRRRQGPGGEPLPEGSLSALRAKVIDITTRFETALSLESETTRETAAIDRVWRWIVSVSLPELEKRAARSDQTVLLPTLRRLIEDLDRRWKSARPGITAPTPADLASAAQDLIASRESRIAVLAKELEFLKGSLEEARRQADHWRSACETARTDGAKLGGEFTLQTKALEDAQRRQKAAEKAFVQAQEKIDILEKRLDGNQLKNDEDQRYKQGQRERERLTLALKQVHAELDSRKQAAAKAQKEHDELLAYFGKGEEQIAKLSAQIGVMEQDIIRRKSQAEMAQSALDGSRLGYDEARRQISRLEQELIDAKTSLAGLEQARHELGVKVADMETERAAAAMRESAMLAQEAQLRSQLAEEKGARAIAEESSSKVFSAQLSEEKLRLRILEMEGKLREAMARMQSSALSAEAAAKAAKTPAVDWTDIAARMRQPIITAHGRLKELYAGQLPQGPKALSKLIASDLAEANDLLRSLGEYFNESPPPAMSVALETILDAAVAAWRETLKKRGIVIRAMPRIKIPPVLAESAGLRQVFNALIKNAYEAMPSGGVLTVSLAKNEGGQLLATFTDSGPGFSPKALQNLFTPFVSEKKARLGLGLALSRKILGRWGADAQAANGAKGSATVTVRLQSFVK